MRRTWSAWIVLSWFFWVLPERIYNPLVRIMTGKSGFVTVKEDENGGP